MQPLHKTIWIVCEQVPLEGKICQGFAGSFVNDYDVIISPIRGAAEKELRIPVP